MPFSDPKALSELITNRMQYDRSYIEKAYPSGVLSTTGGMIFNESVLSVYVDLDRLIEVSPLTQKQRALLGLMMRGYTIQDIADETGKDQSALSHMYARALKAMTETHHARWLEVTKRMYGTGEPVALDKRRYGEQCDHKTEGI